MQQIFPDRSIGAHGQRKLTLRSYKPTGPLNNTVPERVQSFKGPGCRAFIQCTRIWRLGQHLYFTRKIMGHHRTKCKDLVGAQTPTRYQIKTGVIFCITEIWWALVIFNRCLCFVFLAKFSLKETVAPAIFPINVFLLDTDSLSGFFLFNYPSWYVCKY